MFETQACAEFKNMRGGGRWKQNFYSLPEIVSFSDSNK